MYSGGILHPDLSQWIARLGHHNFLLITDAGYPYIEGVPHIYLGFTPGKPRFIDVFESIQAQLPVEKYWIAREMESQNPAVYRQFVALLHDEEPSFVESHELFKEKARASMVVVRTGEVTPFANCLLECGVAF